MARIIGDVEDESGPEFKTNRPPSVIKAVLFDFGGVLADEGFRGGMEAIGRKYGIVGLFEIADALIYETGYVTGKAPESTFWEALRARTGIRASDDELRAEILGRFTMKEEVLRQVDRLKSRGMMVAILSDQTNWLAELDAKMRFLDRFHFVFNSYTLGKGKRDPSIFTDVCKTMGIRPDEALFVDDKIENIMNALDAGLKTIHFRGVEGFEKELFFYLSL